MKRAIVALLLLPLLYCNRESGGRGRGGDFIYTPGSNDKITTGITSHDFTFGGTAYNTCPSGQCYTIIYKGEISGTSYVGIAMSENPSDSNAFNLKIYFPSTSIPTIPIDINWDDPNSKIKVKESGSTFEFGGNNGSGTITLSFTYNSSDNTYTIQSSNADQITLSGTGNTFSANLSIVALYVSK
jgi:hypothetical protein